MYDKIIVKIFFFFYKNVSIKKILSYFLNIRGDFSTEKKMGDFVWGDYGRGILSYIDQLQWFLYKT